VLRVTDATYPLICLQSVGRSTRQDVDAVHPVYVRAYARRQPIVAISDCRLANFDAQQRRLLGEWTKEALALDKGCTLATIILLDSPLLRGALTALNWIAPPTVQQIAASDAPSALDAARHVAQKHGLAVHERTWIEARRWVESSHREAQSSSSLTP
jgi:hypothetical protein